MERGASEPEAMAATTPYEQVMEDMLRGRNFAAELQPLLRDSPKAGLIVDQILHAFSRAIDAAKAMADQEASEVQSEVTCAAGGGGGGGKRKAAAAGAEDRKGTSRRRTHDSSVKTVTTKDLEDGHAWRKYGQKEIQNSKYTRSYFRCTHMYDQHCKAKRQVQRCDDAPESFRVTYIGVHTCRDPATLAPLVVQHLDGAADAGGVLLPAGSRLISFVAASTPTTSTTTCTTGNNNANHQQQQQQQGEAALLSSLPPLRREGGGVDQEEVLSSLTPAGSARNPVATPGPDQGDVTSGLHFLGGGGGVDDLSFDDTFDLEEIEQIFHI